jgi:hypothetical protein
MCRLLSDWTMAAQAMMAAQARMLSILSFNKHRNAPCASTRMHAHLG